MILLKNWEKINETSLTFSHINELLIRWEDNRIISGLREHAFSSQIQRFALVDNNNFHIDIDEFLNGAYQLYKMEMGQVLRRFNYVKTMTVFVLEFEKKVTSSAEEQMRNPNVVESVQKEFAIAVWIILLRILFLIKYCWNTCTIEMPSETTKWIHFKNYKNKLKAPFIIYADTEAYLKHLDTEDKKTNIQWKMLNSCISTTSHATAWDIILNVDIDR